MARSSSKSENLSFLTSKGYTFGSKISINRVSKVKFGNSDLAAKLFKMKNSEDDRSNLETLKQISHPSIVSLHSIIQNGSFTCLFTQWASGGSLFNLLKKSGRIREPKANFWFYQIVCAIKYLHSRNIAYGGLTCKNFLICNQNLKLGDISQLSSCDDESDFKIDQSIPKFYQPPEVLAGGPVNAKKCNIYSLGVILFMMMYAKIPFLTICPVKLFEDQTHRRYTVNASSAVPLSVECQVMLHVLLEPDPKIRFSINKIHAMKWLQKYVDNHGDS